MLRLFSPINEIFYDAYSAVCIAVTPTGKERDSFVNLAVYSDHVTLVFQYGTSLADPEKRLKGGGKQVRHIRLAGIETLRDPYMVRLMKEAEAHVGKNLVADPRTHAGLKDRAPVEEPTQTVKVMNGPKRRPQATV